MVPDAGMPARFFENGPGEAVPLVEAPSRWMRRSGILQTEAVGKTTINLLLIPK